MRRLAAFSKRKDHAISHALKLPLPINKARSQNAKFGPHSKAGMKNAQQGKPSGSEQLARIDKIAQGSHLHAIEEAQGRGRGRGQNAMSAMGNAVGNWQRAADQGGLTKSAIKLADAANIENAVQRAYFMEMNRSNVSPMGGSLAFSQQLKTVDGPLFRFLREAGVSNDLPDVSQIAMFMSMRKLDKGLPAHDSMYWPLPQRQATGKFRRYESGKLAQAFIGRGTIRGDSHLRKQNRGQAGDKDVAGNTSMAADGQQGLLGFVASARLKSISAHKRFTTLAAAHAAP